MKSEEFVLQDTIAKALAVFSSHKTVCISYSGGADSDVVIDFIHRFVRPTPSVMFNTGVELDATLEHVRSMRERYEIDIQRAIVPVPTAVRKHGQPFLSKYVSEMLSRLQRHGFRFREHGNLPFDILYKMYPHCKSALMWWCGESGKTSRFSIARWMYLKEFLVENGLPFRVSGRCCDEAKKKPANRYARERGVDLFVLGIRRSEGGIRSTAYRSCFHRAPLYDKFLPLFFWDDDMVLWYKTRFGVVNSRAYRIYGLSRTGCAACPLASNFERELDALEEYEQKKFVGISRIFAASHAHRRAYALFKKERKGDRR